MRFSYQIACHTDSTDVRSVEIDIEGVNSQDHIIQQITQQKTFYENDLLSFLGRHGPRGGVYVDVGANIGNHSVFFGKFVADFVIAIEPSSALIPVLERNLAINGIVDRLIINRAVAAAPGVGRLVSLGSATINTGARAIVTENREIDSPVFEERAEITTLDRIAEQLSSALGDRVISLIKIDVEGMELSVLKGAEGVIEDHRPQIVAELPTVEEYEVVSSFLAWWNYKEVGRFCATPTYLYVSKG